MIDFNKMIDNHLFREFTPKKIGRYYPSEIGSCIRKLWYSYKYPQQIEPDLLKIFEAGNILHDFVVDVLKSERNPEVELLKYEFPFKVDMKDFIISGRVDDLLLIKENNKNVLVEVKSCRNISLVYSPQLHHMMQLQFYMHALNIHDGILLYIDKNNLQSKVFTMIYDDNESLQVIERFKILHKHLTENSLPVAEAKHVDDMRWMCRFCEYRDRCEVESK